MPVASDRTRPTVVILCEHGEAKPHGPMRGESEAVTIYDLSECPGGRVLNQAIIIERDNQGRWPAAVLDAMYMAYDGAGGWRMKAVLDALASAQENQR